MQYAELQCVSNFSFLRGAATADELFARAKSLGYSALAITDECTMAGIVRAYEAAKKHALKLITGTEIRTTDGLRFNLLARNHAGYSRLCQLITDARRVAKKGSYTIHSSQLTQAAEDCELLWFPDIHADSQSLLDQAQWVAEHFATHAWIGVNLVCTQCHRKWLEKLTAVADHTQLEMVACGDVHMHTRSRRALQDTLTAIRLKMPLPAAGFALHASGERHLRKVSQLRQLYPQALIENTQIIANRCDFNLDSLQYEYPKELAPDAMTRSEYLRYVTEIGIKKRWPGGESTQVRQQIEHELALISKLQYEAYFLTVYDIVNFARSQEILCQGRGSAANSAVCYCLGITEVDPARGTLLFERFISEERNEPPDIDVDFEHQRREEVIQYIYSKYGRHRAALAATVITYRARSAVRDVAKALGMDAEQIERLARALTRWDHHEVLAERLRERGFDPNSPVIHRLLILVDQVIGFPRHLSQHVGGFVISEHPLHHLVPVENASMPDRTVIQWDKDDLEALALLKVDCLALGMLSAIRRCFDMISAYRGRTWTMATIPAEDPSVYAMIQTADTIGVFQIESRAQMSMLPRLKPACFYDLVIEVAIVRPGPIQGKMVHPYLRRRQGLEPVDYPSEDLRAVFERTLGVPIFQEQVMQLAIVAAGFSAGEADQLRRSMAAWKRHGGLEHFENRIVNGMRERGYDESFAHRVFEQIKGFGSYGFPESHAASFALLVYVSAWLKCHEPAAFCCALLNSLPMGFYPASQLIQDARNHAVEVRPADVCHSRWDSHLEPDTDTDQPAIRLGLRLVKGFNEAAANRIVAARPFRDVQHLAQTAQLNRRELDALSRADALASLSGNRHQTRWAVAGIEQFPPLLATTHIPQDTTSIRAPTEAESVILDYRSTGLTLRTHPLGLIREQLQERRARTIAAAKREPSGTIMRVAGLVTLRQRPGSASGVTFVTLEDETGLLNAVIWKDLAVAQRRDLLESDLLAIDGTLEHHQGVYHLIAKRLWNYDSLLSDLQIKARNFC